MTENRVKIYFLTDIVGTEGNKQVKAIEREYGVRQEDRYWFLTDLPRNEEWMFRISWRMCVPLNGILARLQEGTTPDGAIGYKHPDFDPQSPVTSASALRGGYVVPPTNSIRRKVPQQLYDQLSQHQQGALVHAAVQQGADLSTRAVEAMILFCHQKYTLQ
jgi:hypothetical protein